MIKYNLFLLSSILKIYQFRTLMNQTRKITAMPAITVTVQQVLLVPGQLSNRRKKQITQELGGNRQNFHLQMI